MIRTVPPDDSEAIRNIYNHYVENTVVTFEKVAHFKEVGRKFDRWIDVGYWEVIFDASPASSPQSE